MQLRGQEAVFEGGGVYRYNPTSFAREGIVWDVINLVIGLPLFALGAFAALRNSIRGRLLLGGMLAYFWYVYLGSSLMYAFNDLFLVYVAIFALSSIAFVQNVAGIDVPGLAGFLGARFPRRTFIAYTLAFSALLLVMWVGRIAEVIRTWVFPPEYAGITTLGSQALDLGLVVPLGIATGVLLWKRSPWGYYLASVAVTFGFMMSIAIPGWIGRGQLRSWNFRPSALLPLIRLVFSIRGRFLHCSNGSHRPAAFQEGGKRTDILVGERCKLDRSQVAPLPIVRSNDDPVAAHRVRAGLRRHGQHQRDFGFRFKALVGHAKQAGA